jgi:putative hydrolase of the HAD superfamily
MTTGIPWIIFDADNTLWSVEHLYDDARAKLCVYLATKGIDAAVSEDYQRKRDAQLYETYGYSACRFARSFEDTLLYFRPETAAEDVRYVRGLALEVFDQRVEVADGLGEVITRLAEAFHLGVITAGEQWVQERRLADFHLRSRFAADQVVPTKDVNTFRKFCEKHRVAREQSCVVGDSLKSDIKPAQDAGLFAVRIVAANWSEVESENTDIRPDAVIRSLRELLTLPRIAAILRPLGVR